MEDPVMLEVSRGGRVRGFGLDQLHTTQLAFERIAANHEKFAKAHNANGQLLKECEIELQKHAEKLRKLQEIARKA
jgi:hypothetical protein